jgi:hypothetical protein
MYRAAARVTYSAAASSRVIFQYLPSLMPTRYCHQEMPSGFALRSIALIVWRDSATVRLMEGITVRFFAKSSPPGPRIVERVS